jgi:hypothetical protein
MPRPLLLLTALAPKGEPVTRHDFLTEYSPKMNRQ